MRPVTKVMDGATRRAILGQTRIFQGLAAAELEAIAAAVVVRRFDRGEMLLRRGDVSTGMFVIATGKARISLISENGREVTLGIVGQGEVIGEMALLDSGECSADASAQEDCVVLFIERAQFLQLLRRNADLCLHLLAMLSRRLRRANATLEEMALHDLPARLGRLLLRLADEHGAFRGNGRRIELTMSQKELSTLVGGSREKVNKQLRRWEQDGVLAKEGSRIMVLRPEALTPPPDPE